MRKIITSMHALLAFLLVLTTCILVTGAMIFGWALDPLNVLSGFTTVAIGFYYGTEQAEKQAAKKQELNKTNKEEDVL